MGTPSIQLRISPDANEALKKVVARFPKWSLAQLGDTLIVESCTAILEEKAPEFPTINYIRQQIGQPVTYSDLETIAARIEEAAATFGAEKKKQAARGKRAA